MNPLTAQFSYRTFTEESRHFPGLQEYQDVQRSMKAQSVIYRISYSVYDEVVRPLPQFYFYVRACSEQQALAKLNAYAEEEDIDYRSVAVGYTLPAKELPEAIELESLAKGCAMEREVPALSQSSKVPAVA